MKQKIAFWSLVGIFLIGVFYSFRGLRSVLVASARNEKCIVIDSGHGGNDPGKIGVTGTKEKDINLQIAKRVEDKLKKMGYQVVMTRNGDESLAPVGSRNKKREDMQQRIKIIEKANPKLTVSIHQNSYPSGSVKGAQVFYYGSSETSKKLAEQMQEGLRSMADPENKRLSKANSDYYLLRKSNGPLVIVECGFLSNAAEEQKLKEETYQEKIADAIMTVVTKCQLE